MTHTYLALKLSVMHSLGNTEVLAILYAEHAHERYAYHFTWPSCDRLVQHCELHSNA